MTRHKHTRGFTLVEMLVAMLAFSMLVTAAISILNLSLRNQEAFKASSTIVQDIQVARSIMKADMGQLAPRPVRDSFGGRPHSSFAQGSAGGRNVVLSFVRRGWDNPAGDEARGSLQYVEYILDGTDLLRRTRPYLDAAPQTPTSTTRLFADVAGVKIAFLNGEAWTGQWRPVGTNAELPKALAITVTLTGLGEIRQAFLTPAL